MADDDYQYDVFFSYRRDPLIQDWIMEVVTRLRFRLTQDLGGDQARIFWDRDIEVGDIWPEKLRDAVQKSKCLVPVWSPSYFQSAWCLSEWQSFLAREKRFAVSPRLIAPVKYHDGEHFPEEARRVQWDDFSPYTATVRSFWDRRSILMTELRIFPLPSPELYRVFLHSCPIGR